MNKEELEKAIVEKIEEMESPEYEFPERFSKNQYLIVLVSVIVSASILIAGAFI